MTRCRWHGWSGRRRGAAAVGAAAGVGRVWHTRRSTLRRWRAAAGDSVELRRPARKTVGPGGNPRASAVVGRPAVGRHGRPRARATLHVRAGATWAVRRRRRAARTWGFIQMNCLLRLHAMQWPWRPGRPGHGQGQGNLGIVQCPITKVKIKLERRASASTELKTRSLAAPKGLQLT